MSDPEDLKHSALPTENAKVFGRYYFRESGLSFGRNILDQPLLHEMTDLLVIDEVGRFEVMGKVWGESIDQIMKRPWPPMIWTVRRCFVEAVTDKWPVPRQVVFEVGKDHCDQIVPFLIEEIEKYRSITLQ